MALGIPSAPSLEADCRRSAEAQSSPRRRAVPARQWGHYCGWQPGVPSSTIKDKLKKGAAFAGIEKPGIKDLGGNKLSVEFLHWRHRQKLQAFLELVPGIKAVCMTVPRQRYMRQYLKSWSSEMHCSQLAFGRLVADIVRDHRPQATTKLTTEAVACLQLAAEEYITCFLNNAWSLSLHAKRKTLMLTDLRLAQRRSQDGKKEIANCLPELPKRKRRRVEAA